MGVKLVLSILFYKDRINLTVQEARHEIRAMAQAASHRPLTARPGFVPRSFHVGFLVDKVAP
jgi:hypothetical protein